MDTRLRESADDVDLTPASPAPMRLRLGRTLLIGALLIPPDCYWVIRMERVGYGPYPSTVSLFANVVFVLFALVGINRLLKRYAPAAAFSQAELLVVYTMLAIATGLAGLDGVGMLSQIAVHGAWYATPSNGWNRFLGAFAGWLVVRDRSVAAGHFNGHSSFYAPRVLAAWAAPILSWTGIVTLLLFVAQCVNVLVRPLWADQERLTFPIIRLPVEMSEQGTGPAFFASRTMWCGFALAAGVSVWNGIGVLYPTWPSIPVGLLDLSGYFRVRPWSAVTWFPISFYPLIIGLGFLLPLDLLFSCVFFYLLWNAQVVVSNAMAWDTTPDFPFITEQGFGSVIGLFAVYAWSGRRYYRAIWREAWRGGSARA